jgi:hypothetical protein
MDYINLAEAKGRLWTIKEAYLQERKNAAASAVRECIETLEKMPKAKPEIKIVTPEANRTVSVEPFFYGGQIGRDVYRCGNCREKVNKHDNFCHQCGRKLVDQDE